jgi:hypothetical protein
MQEQREREIVYNKFQKTGEVNRDRFKVLHNVLVDEVQKIVLRVCYLVGACIGQVHLQQQPGN